MLAQHHYQTWHQLSATTNANGIVELMAATSDDGIGVIARWIRREDGSYFVQAIDTEGGKWEPVSAFTEDEPIPPTPPVCVTPDHDVLALQGRNARLEAELAQARAILHRMTAFRGKGGREDEPPSAGSLAVDLAAFMSRQPDGPPLHDSTEILLQRYHRALRIKAAEAEAEHGYTDGWAHPGWMDACRHDLFKHLLKGDPRDVALYTAFLWHHGENTHGPKGEPIDGHPAWLAETVAAAWEDGRNNVTGRTQDLFMRPDGEEEGIDDLGELAWNHSLPLCRFEWGELPPEPGAGLVGFSGWQLAKDQSDTLLSLLVNGFESFPIHWEYEDQLPPHGEKDFANLFTRSQVRSGVRMYPYIELPDFWNARYFLTQGGLIHFEESTAPEPITEDNAEEARQSA